MKLTSAEARDIVYGDREGWTTIETCIVDKSRWSTIHDGVFLHEESGKHYSLNWSVGATESQDERAFEYETEVEPIEVRQVEKIVKAWEAVVVPDHTTTPDDTATVTQEGEADATTAATDQG